MANYFALIPKGSTERAILQAVDEVMCIHFGVPIHPTQWYRGWYDTIGLGLALGRSWDDLREVFPEQADIIDWLEANYTVEAWADRGDSR